MSIIRSPYAPVVTVLRAAMLAFFIGLVGQGVWTALFVVNLRTAPALPWTPVAMGLLLWAMWQYLGGRWWPRSTSEARRCLLRASAVPAPVMGWALLAGALSIAALAGLWILMAQIVRMPSNVLPDMSQYPRLTTALLVATGSLVSPVLEQAGFWGYCQVTLERQFAGPVAVVITAILFAILPHPPTHATLWPKFSFYFLTGVEFGAIAYLTDSILPGLLVHVGGILTFFVLVWPYDTARPLLAEGGAKPWFWVHAAQTIVFTALAVSAFIRLANVAEAVHSAGSEAQTTRP